MLGLYYQREKEFGTNPIGRALECPIESEHKTTIEDVFIPPPTAVDSMWGCVVVRCEACKRRFWLNLEVGKVVRQSTL